MSDTRPAEKPTDGRAILTGNLIGAASMIVWSAGFPAADLLLEIWDPIVVVLFRYGTALLLLLPIWVLAEGLRALAGPGTPRALIVGGIGFGGGAVSILFAQWYTDPVTVAIIAAASPLTATLVDWVYLRRPLTRPFVVGLFLSVAGGVVAAGGSPGTFGIGAALALLSCLLFSWASFLTPRILPDHTTLGRTTVTLLGGMAAVAVATAVLFALGLARLPPAPFGTREIGLLLVYGILAMAVSQWLWIASVDRLGVSLASFHINVAPFYVMLILLALGGGWDWRQALGAAIVGSGVILAQIKI